MAKNTKSGFAAVSEDFDVITLDDFEKKNSGYLVGYKQAIAQCKSLESQLNDLRKDIKTKDDVINNLTIANGIYTSTTLVNIIGVIMTVIGSAGVGLAFKAPLTNDRWKWAIAILSLLFSVTGTVLPLLIRLIASRAVDGKHNKS